MKHKPSTKRQLHVSHHTALKKKKKKMNRLYWKTFFSLWMVKEIHRTDSELWTWLCHLHAPNPTWQQERGEKKRWKTRKSKEKQRKMEQRYSSDDSSVSLWRWLWLKGLLWLVRTNKAVWERSSATETTISSHHCQVLLPWHPHPMQPMCTYSIKVTEDCNHCYTTLHCILGRSHIENNYSFINLFLFAYST